MSAPFDTINGNRMPSRPDSPQQYETLIEITEATHDVRIDLVYATSRNLTGEPIYRHPRCTLLAPAEAALRRAAAFARQLGLQLKVFDAYRPPEAQKVLWDFLPDPMYVADLKRGSHHSRGAAVDLTLVDARGAELDMGTGFDAMTEHSHHFRAGLPHDVQRNRMMLIGVMHAAGFTHIPNEWWHYQLPDAMRYRLIPDADNPLGPML
jgi:D-alanyl-D-alanine dipeptidase